ncbi:Splicing factor 3B subunit 3 [Auxenochlorella protothecoides]|uniref:Splicing factor 3B subunit 3 n=1 Tax=Auxenochlorella protothecoides TaxID=3075 RepID=A0A087SI01_AUXPR|nr:Splicing factor 3B subunit 3 [Auxenochlorella protothecoides]KFM25355.1 Splicing factor 3B subunit 3 [Auxenochlorella protothecoides]
MYLYNLTLSRASAITSAIYGNFSAPKLQEIIVSRGKVLELLRPDENGRMQTICSTEVFGLIRAIQPFRFPGAQQDYVICGSDSGRIIILQFSKEKNAFVKIHQETFGKSGARRIVPGEHLAVDPKGRACLIGALEKQKFVYVLNRDNEARLTISSPLEAHRGQTLVYSVVGLDMGFDNPIFAAIELDYTDVDQDPTGEAASEAQKHLTLYELDLGLNHVVRKQSDPIDNGANMLVPIPGGGDGPGGVIVCAENFVIYRAVEGRELRAVIPRRSSLPGEKSVLIVSAATHKQKNLFFVLLQSEYGDLYKLTLDYEGEIVRDMHVKYFDTIPPASSICVMRKGFLFAASELGDHALYQFQARRVFFDPRPLTNLDPIDSLESLAPILDLKLANLANEEIPQLYAACGRGCRSSLRVLRPGLGIAEMAVSPLPGNPTAVWTVRRSQAAEYDAYIVVSFANATLVMSIGETVEEVSDSGLAGGLATLGVQLLADDSLLQVHAGGLRHVALALAGGDLLLFELNAQGQLVESEKRPLGGEALGAAPESLLLAASPGGGLTLAVGLATGLLLRTEVDPVTGALSDTRSRFLGTRAPRLFRVALGGAPAMLALSSRPWLGYADQGRFALVPGSHAALDWAAPFASEQCPEGFVAVAGGQLRVLAVERLGQRFDQRAVRLRYTPRELLIHPDHKFHAVGLEAGEESAAALDQVGCPTGLPGRWGSCVRVVDPLALATTDCVELGGNEAALCAALVGFEGEDALVLAVGVARGLSFYPKQSEGGAIHIYRFGPGGRALELVHTTPLDDIPRAMVAFRGRLLAGVGASVRLYDLGKKRLLRKSEYRKLPTAVAKLAVNGNRVYVGDASQSFLYLKYKKSDNSFYVFADDTVPRSITAALNLDYDTMAGADRFGNLHISRLPPELSAQVEEDPTGGKFAGQSGVLGGASNKLDSIINFHVGETVTALQRGTLQPGGREVLIYSTILGGLGTLFPFASREDLDFFQHLELHMRAEAPPLLGRDHLAFRSAYFPVKSVVDGDICEQFAQLPIDKQRQIASELDRSPGEVLKKLEDVRNRII